MTYYIRTNYYIVLILLLKKQVKVSYNSKINYWKYIIMKTKLHTALLYPLVLLFAAFLKGKKSEYSKFFTHGKIATKKELLQVKSKEISFYNNIKLFFDKYSPLYDKTLITFELDLNIQPEEKKYFSFDFSRIISIYYTLSMLSARVTNKNIDLKFSIQEKKLTDTQMNNFLRYSLFTFASKKVDSLTFDAQKFSDDKNILAYDTMVSHLDNAIILNFTNAKNLYVLTCKKDKKKFDVIWSSYEDIELTEFNKVYDKYGQILKKDIKISNSPIYAFHK